MIMMIMRGMFRSLEVDFEHGGSDLKKRIGDQDNKKKS